jgi:CubicO group peptidase (beta-lactamase class C family)
MNRSLQRACHAAALSMIVQAAAPVFAAIATSPQVIQQHIDRIGTDLPPAVVIDGRAIKKASLAERMRELHVPGISVALIHNGTLEWARGYGALKAGGSPVTADTLFQAASISKPVTALAVLRLVDAGKINLDANANDYLKSWKIPDNEFTGKKSVTVRELLSHTGGITVPGFGGYLSDEALPTLLQSLNGEPPANNVPIRVDIEPNTRWRYAGGGYVILRQLIEDVTGEPFSKVLQDSVLTPAGMTHSFFEQPLSAAHLAAAAVPHDREGHVVGEGPKVYPELAPDGLWATASDIARFAIAIQRSIAGEPGSLLSPATARSMLTPGPLSAYALGAIVGDDERVPWFTHNGGNYGYPCVFVAYNKGDGAVVMSNGANGYELDVAILRSIAKEYNWPDFKPIRHRIAAVNAQIPARYVGVYQLSTNRFAAVFKDGKELSFQATDRPRQPVYPLGANEFLLSEPSVNGLLNRDEETRLRFKIDGQGKVTDMVVSTGRTSEQPAKRLADAEAGPILTQMANIDRRFRSQVPAQGGEKLLRQLMADISIGELNKSMVTPQLQTELEGLRVLNQHVFSRLGPAQSLSYVRTSPTGTDTYHVVFSNGEGDMDIRLAQNERLQYLQYFPG